MTWRIFKSAIGAAAVFAAIAAAPHQAAANPSSCTLAVTGVTICNDINGLGTGLAAWTAAVGGKVQSIDLSGPISTLDPGDGHKVIGLSGVPSITTPNGTILTLGAGFNRDLVGTSQWRTWSNGSTPFVVDSYTQDTLTITLSQNLPAFGLEMEPGEFSFDMSVTLSDGTVIPSAGPVVAGACPTSDSCTIPGGAQFFGWVGATDITSITLQCGDPTTNDCGIVGDDQIGFAFGNLVVPVPEPASISIFAAGLLGFTAWRRRRAQAV